jgi:1,4-dihydroxy-2-naphthoate octaprenyltransferase
MGGLIPMGILAAASGELHGEILFWSLPFILGISLIMLSNNGCDIEKDEKAGRHTLAVLLGKERTVFLYHVLVWLWLFFICVCACLISGIWGLTAPVLLLVGGRKVFAEQAGTKLLQEQRIWQMKSVLKANVAGNGAYFLAIAAALIGRRLL